MGDPVALASAAFKNECAAEALFFYGGHQKGLRVEAREIALEFTDNAYIGTDPEGFLFYNDVQDLTSGGTHTYTVKSLNYRGTYYAIIDFVRNSESRSYAQFVAKDPANVASKMGPYSNSGRWIDLDGHATNAIIEKTSSNEIQVHIKSVGAAGKTGAWNSSPTISTQSRFRVKGMIYYKRESDLNQGLYANYQDDRVVFYRSDYLAKDFTAYFIPLQSETTKLGWSGTPVVFSGVRWTG